MCSLLLTLTVCRNTVACCVRRAVWEFSMCSATLRVKSTNGNVVSSPKCIRRQFRTLVTLILQFELMLIIHNGCDFDFVGEISVCSETKSDFHVQLNQINDQGVIGVEYIIEVSNSSIGKHCASIFHCVLCEGTFDLQVVLNHLTTFLHRLKYLVNAPLNLSSYCFHANFPSLSQIKITLD